jgi:electron transport complex protein RnfC
MSARQVFDFHGGIHPTENKVQSVTLPIAEAGIPEQLIYPLSQHIGAPSAPIVAVGDKVLKGQLLAEAKGFVSVPLHASTSGEIIAIAERTVPHPSGMSAPCIILKPDGKDQWIDHHGVVDYQQVDSSELINRIRNAGIAGMGGAGFPSAVKLATDKPIETLIINGTECEPYITADDILMRERAEQIIEGAKILKHIIKPLKETLIGVEDNKPEGIAELKKAAEGTGIEVVVFPTKYPSGGEKQLIEILTGKQVPSGGLPADIGIVCQNIGTTVAIRDAIIEGKPLISRITTVTGDACQQPRNYEVLLGTPVEHLLKLAGYNAKHCSRLVMGGPMMGFALESEHVPVVKTTNCILAPTPKELPAQQPAQACIRCGMCAEACPVSLLPQQMYCFARGKEYEKLEAHNIFDCIECGACSYACPSNIPLVQYYRASKTAIRQQKEDAVKAEQSKARFEARKERIERLEAEKEAKRAARKAAAEAKAKKAAEGGNDEKSDVIQAAIDRAKAKKAAVDPAQAAIEKAKAKRDGTLQEEAPTLESLEKAFATADKRLNNAKAKLAQAEETGNDKVDAFRTSVEKMQAKFEEAEKALTDFKAQVHTEPAPSADPAQAAIERAKAKREQADNQSPQDKAEQQVTSLKKRLAKAEEKLAMAREQDSDKLEIFENSVTGLKEKLQLAEEELHEFNGSSPREAEELPEQLDAAQMAIRKAMQSRDNARSMTPEQKLKKAAANVDERIAKTKDKLEAARAEGADTVEILENTLEKLEQKRLDVQQQLAELN